MSVPKYIVNLPELEGLIREAISGGDDITSKIQRSIGFMAVSKPHETDELVWKPIEDIGIIGFRFGQEDIRNMGYLDNFDLIIEDDIVLEGIYHKELNEYKDFRVPYLVAEGSDVRIINRNETGIEKEVKFDIDYIEATIPEKELIITCIDIDTNEIITKFTNFYKPIFEGVINPPNITNYNPVTPPKNIYIGVQTITPKVIKFYYEQVEPPPPIPPVIPDQPPIDHMYNWKLVMRWENGVDVDLDFHAVYDGKEIYYANREDLEKDGDGETIRGIWLDHDYTSHTGANDRAGKPEIMTILGSLTKEVKFYIRNYRNGDLLTEEVTVDIYKLKGDGQDELIKSISKSPHLFHGHKADVNIAIIDLELSEVTEL